MRRCLSTPVNTSTNAQAAARFFGRKPAIAACSARSEPFAARPCRSENPAVTESVLQNRLQLETPHAGLQDSYRNLVREFVERGEPLVPFTLSFPNDDFEAFLSRLAACSRGEGLPPGFVPHTTFWLVRDGVEVVGVSNLRHELTDALRREGGNIGYGIRPSARGFGLAHVLLRHTLGRARELGLAEAWLSCAKGNKASAATILANGGEFVSEELIDDRGEIMQRYRIRLDGNTDAFGGVDRAPVSANRNAGPGKGK